MGIGVSVGIAAAVGTSVAVDVTVVVEDRAAFKPASSVAGDCSRVSNSVPGWLLQPTMKIGATRHRSKGVSFWFLLLVFVSPVHFW